MNRIDFVSDIKKISHVFKHGALNHANIRIYLDDRLQTRVQSMKLHVDLTYGYIRASVVRNRNDGNGIVFDADNNFVMEDINPNLDKDALILERVDDNGNHTNFYLRTIITI